MSAREATGTRVWGDALQRMLQRIDATIPEPAEAGFPHFADPETGSWTRTPNGDWTGAFWNGLLWLAARATREGRYRSAARQWARRLRPRARSETVFRGFLFWYGAALGSVLFQEDEAREIALEGASGLAELYNPAARAIPLGIGAEEASDVGRAEANIDGVPGGTPLLIWAARQGGDVRLEEMGVAHAQRHIELCVREDGSVCQSASFDPRTGGVRRRYTHKGVRDDSTWARAQAWAMLGFAQAAYWHPQPFLPIARRVSDWWLDHLPASGVSYWDFDDPAIPNSTLDTSATAIAAASLLKLAKLAPGGAERYHEGAHRMVAALVSGHLTPVGSDDPRPPGILADGCYNRRIGLATSNELIWGDYFLFESLCGLDGRLATASI